MDNIRLNVTHNSEELSIEEAILSYVDIKDGFKYSIQEVAFKVSEFNKFIKDLENLVKFKEYDYSKGKNSVYKKYIGEDIRFYVRGNSLDIFGSAYVKSEDMCKKIWDLFLKHSEEDESVDVFMTSYFMNSGQLDESTKKMKPEEFSYISEKYYPYIDTKIMFDQFFTGAENILLLVGDPGLGKSKMSTLAIKHAFEYSDMLPYDKIKDNPALEVQYINCVYVKSNDVLINDKFWRSLEKAQADFVIIDDLDYMLTKRDAEVTSSDDAIKNTFLNQFLSFTDGVEKHKTKFIITTNQKYNDIDTALLRKGRLFDILELRQLDQKEALEIWIDNGLSVTEFHNVFHDHHVLPADLGSEINKRLNDRIDSATVAYLKEDGISKVIKASRVKKIGV